GKNLCYEGGNRVAQLPLYGESVANEPQALRKSLEGSHLLNTETPILPMEWPYRWPRLCLYCPRGFVFCQFQEKAPKASPPTKKRQPTFALGVPKIVFTLGN